MAIRTDEDLEKIFDPIIKDVINSISERAMKLLIQHINTDTYGINKTEEGKPTINDYYLNGTGTPSYEFRDIAWDKKVLKQGMIDYIGSIIYDGDRMTAPSQSSPYLHGNFNKGEDRRSALADYLNVNGIDIDNDFGGKKRRAFWDNFEKELEEKIGNWFYTEFNNRGITIPSLKTFKG